MHPQFILVEHSNLRVCRFRLKETLGLAYHYYLSEQRDFAQSLGWGPTGLEVQGRVRVTAKELERAERFIAAASYSIAANNCEHFAKYVKYGLPLSSQMERWWNALGAEFIARLQPMQDKKGNISDYVGKQASDVLKKDLRQARIARANKERHDFWMQRGIDLS
jgi:hypothetical protein